MYSKLYNDNHLYLYHFTDVSNIAFIKKYGGLYSYKQLQSKEENNSIKYGGNDWSHQADNIASVDDYVHLCFLRNHPMEYMCRVEGRISETVWLEISIEILKKTGVCFTNDISNKTDVCLLSNKQALINLDYEAIYSFLDFRIEGNQKRKSDAEKYEILIPQHIPLAYIKGV